MTPTTLCQDCFHCVRHEGEPEGIIDRLGGEAVYIGTPSLRVSQNQVLLYLPDAYGIQFKNNQLLIDDFARNGFKTIGIDYFRGNQAPDNARVGKFDENTWLKQVMPGMRSAIDNVVAALREQGVVHLAAVGYCMGARYVFDLAFEDTIEVACIAHPALLRVPHDFERYRSVSKAPLLVNSCEFDMRFPPDDQQNADKILAGDNFSPGYKRTYWRGCKHGFAVRGDLNKPEVKAAKEGAFKASVEFFHEHFRPKQKTPSQHARL